VVIRLVVSHTRNMFDMFWPWISETKKNVSIFPVHFSWHTGTGRLQLTMNMCIVCVCFHEGIVKTFDWSLEFPWLSGQKQADHPLAW
jgi:hypothetical protein